MTKRFINNAKEYTNIGGIHIIQIFTDTVPASEDIAPFAIGLAKDEEIKGLYSDWEILQLKSYVFYKFWECRMNLSWYVFYR